MAPISPNKGSAPSVSGAMPIEDIILLLAKHGCTIVANINDATLTQVACGGYGEVYKGALLDDTPVGLKCLKLKIDTAQGRKQLRRSAHELYVWSKCKHRNVHKLIGVTRYGERIAMVSPWMERGNLKHFLSQSPKADIYAVCTQIIDAVVYLHKEETVHGDIKGENILVSQDNTPMLTDFGTAGLSEYTLHFSATKSQGMTVRWSAPELLEKEECRHTRESDVYALGMTILEVITGSVPYANVQREAAVVLKIVKPEHPIRPEELLAPNNKQADLLWELLTNCWAYNPKDRPTALEVHKKAKTIGRKGFERFKMTLQQLFVQLRDEGCPDITDQLNMSGSRELPLATGLDDIYVGTRLDSTQVGIKFLSLADSTPEGQQLLRRAAREIHVWSKCKHDNVLELIGLAQYQDRIAMVSPLMENGTLSWFLSQQPQVDRYSLCAQISSAVAYLHAEGIAHGSINGLNILISGDHNVKLAGFGNATLSDVSLDSGNTGSSLDITVRWVAPEVLQERTRNTPEADIYSLGMTILQIMTGSVPYSNVPREYAVVRQVNDKVHPTRPAELSNPDDEQAEAVWSLLTSCWAYDPGNRPAAMKVRDTTKAIARVTNTEKMTPDDVLEILCIDGCCDITDQLNLDKFSESPEQSGGLAGVYVGALLDGTRVGLKCLGLPSDSTSGGHKLLKRVAAKLSAWSKHKHPNIVELLGLAKYQDRIAMISPLMENGNLSWFLSQNSQVDRYQLCLQICEAVASLHGENIVHGDIQASNIFVSKDLTPKLGGFIQEALSGYTTDYSTPIEPTSIYGLRWKAPEILQYKTGHTLQADVYALGMTILEVITGSVPYESIVDDLVISKINSGEHPTRPEKYIPSKCKQADQLWSLLTECWEEEPEDRPSTSEVHRQMRKMARKK